MKATEQWIAKQQHVLPDCEWQHITFTIPDKLWQAFANNWQLLNQLFAFAANTLLKWAKKFDIKISLFVALHAYDRQLNQHPHTHLSVTRRDYASNTVSGAPSFSKRKLRSVTDDAFTNVDPTNECCVGTEWFLIVQRQDYVQKYYWTCVVNNLKQHDGCDKQPREVPFKIQMIV